MKRKLLLGAMVLLAAFMFAGASHAKVVVIGNDNVATEQPDVSMVQVPKIGEEECKGFHYGTYIASDDKAVTVNRLTVEPNGTVAHHPVGAWYVCYIMQGKGTLGLTDGEKKPMGSVEYGPGDVIVFKPTQLLHHWTNGPEETVMIGVSYAPPK